MDSAKSLLRRQFVLGTCLAACMSGPALPVKAEAQGRLGPNLVLTTKSDDELFERIINGKQGTAMAPNRMRMSEQDIRAVIAYLRSLQQLRPGMPDLSPSQGSPTSTETLNHGSGKPQCGVLYLSGVKTSGT
jgi:hypothetical protein